MRLYRAENLKYRHTVTGKLWILMQTLTLLLAYGISRGNGISSAYNWWYILMLPGMVTLSACMIIEKDRKGKNRAVLSLPVSPEKVWDAKILVGMKTLLLANIFGGAANLILGLYLIPGFWIPQALEISPAQIAAAGAVWFIILRSSEQLCYIGKCDDDHDTEQDHKTCGIDGIFPLGRKFLFENALAE